MNQDQLHAILALIVPQVIQRIMDSHNVDNIKAAKLFYGSKLYEMLENERSKLWRLSAPTLHELFEEELAEGTIHYPEEA